ncbi:MAG: peptidylprolyl isomerase, partial [Candidatus Latescibacteria bacterium]|nr:peptidylprolyl isomerase [Candidatus Latescibacterota bacterium]
ADVARRAPVEPGAKYAQGESRLFAWSDVGVHAMQNVIFRHSAGDIVGPLHVGRGQVMLVQLDTLYRGPEAVERHFVKLSRWLKRRHQTQVMRRARRELFDSYGVSINSQAISRLARDYPKRTMRWLRRAPGGAGDLHLALTAAGPLTAKKMGQLALTLPRRLRSTLDDKDAVAQAARYLAVEFLCSIAEARRLGIHRRPLEVEAFTSRQHRFMVERLVSEAVDGVAQKPTDEEIAQAVEEHGDRLLTLGKVTVREILLPTQKAAVDIKRRIARGESFGALADIYSLRLRYGERPKGGMVMLTSADQKPSVAIVQAAFDAKLRRVTGPITTDDGVSLLYVERREAPTRMDAKSGRATIVESLVRNLVNQRYTEFTDSLRSEADLIVFDSALKLVDIGR